MTQNSAHHRALANVIAEVLSPSQFSRVRELSGKRGRSDEMMRWMRSNMPTAAQQVEEILYPAD